MINIWTDFARSYDRVLRHWDPYLALVEKALRHHQGARRVLEQGCGTGIIADALAAKGIEVEAIDNNADMLDVARRRAESRPTLRASLADALHLPYEDRRFDGVVSNNVIFYVDDPVRLLTEARRVLAPGGVLTISGPQPDPDVVLLETKTLEEFSRKRILEDLRGDLGHFTACTRALKQVGMPNVYRLPEILSLLREAGFRNVVETDDTVYHGQSWFVATR